MRRILSERHAVRGHRENAHRRKSSSEVANRFPTRCSSIDFPGIVRCFDGDVPVTLDESIQRISRERLWTEGVQLHNDIRAAGPRDFHLAVLGIFRDLAPIYTAQTAPLLINLSLRFAQYHPMVATCSYSYS